MALYGREEADEPSREEACPEKCEHEPTGVQLGEKGHGCGSCSFGHGTELQEAVQAEACVGKSGDPADRDCDARDKFAVTSSLSLGH